MKTSEILAARANKKDKICRWEKSLVVEFCPGLTNGNKSWQQHECPQNSDIFVWFAPECQSKETVNHVDLHSLYIPLTLSLTVIDSSAPEMLWVAMQVISTPSSYWTSVITSRPSRVRSDIRSSPSTSSSTRAVPVEQNTVEHQIRDPLRYVGTTSLQRTLVSTLQRALASTPC